MITNVKTSEKSANYHIAASSDSSSQHCCYCQKYVTYAVYVQYTYSIRTVLYYSEDYSEAGRAGMAHTVLYGAVRGSSGTRRSAVVSPFRGSLDMGIFVGKVSTVSQPSFPHQNIPPF